MIALENQLDRIVRIFDQNLGQSFGRIQEELEQLGTVTQIMAKAAVGSEKPSEEEWAALVEYHSERAAQEEVKDESGSPGPNLQPGV